MDSFPLSHNGNSCSLLSICFIDEFYMRFHWEKKRDFSALKCLKTMLEIIPVRGSPFCDFPHQPTARVLSSPLTWAPHPDAGARAWSLLCCWADRTCARDGGAGVGEEGGWAALSPDLRPPLVLLQLCALSGAAEPRGCGVTSGGRTLRSRCRLAGASSPVSSRGQHCVSVSWSPLTRPRSPWRLPFTLSPL